MIWILALLFAFSMAGLAYALLQAMYSGAEVYSGAYSEATAKQFEDIFLFIPPRRIAEAGWAVAAASFFLVFLLTGDLTSLNGLIVGLILGTIAATLALQLPRRFVAILKQRRLHRFNNQLVDTLVGMSNGLKDGFSITQTFETVARDGEIPISQEFDAFLQQTRIGVNFADALRNMEDRVGSDDLMLVVRAIESARQTGGNLTEIFEKIAATIRERMRIEGRIRTLTAQGRLQGIVVGAMPVIIATALMIVDPGMMLPFFHSMMGIGVIIAVAILVLCGALVIRKIIRIDI